MKNDILVLDQYNFLVRSLGLVAQPFKEQQNILSEYDDVLDEVVSNFSYSLLFVPQLMEIHKLSYNTVAKILQCNTHIELNLTIDEKITEEAFEHDPSWQEIRNLAKKALIEMGEFNWKEKVKPNLLWADDRFIF